MERASRLLVEMDYLASESLCLQGLAMAKADEDWTAYARVLLPLQECRRQRRMIAADAGVQLGTNACWNDPRDGCVAVTHPLAEADAARISREAIQHGRYVEVLWCDNPPEASTWNIKTFNNGGTHCPVACPELAWINQRLDPAADPAGQAAAGAAGHWFIAASEALGDAALAGVTAPRGTRDRIDQLEAAVAAVGDHEILHQRLADAARAMPTATPA